MYCSGKSHTSNRVESLSFGLPHFGQSLGVACLCFRFFATSRKFWSMPILGFVAPVDVFVVSLMLFLCCLLGSLVDALGSLLRGLGGRLGVLFVRFWLCLRRRRRFSFFVLGVPCRFLFGLCRR